MIETRPLGVVDVKKYGLFSLCFLQVVHRFFWCVNKEFTKLDYNAKYIYISSQLVLIGHEFDFNSQLSFDQLLFVYLSCLSPCYERRNKKTAVVSLFSPRNLTTFTYAYVLHVMLSHWNSITRASKDKTLLFQCQIRILF